LRQHARLRGLARLRVVGLLEHMVPLVKRCFRAFHGAVSGSWLTQSCLRFAGVMLVAASAACSDSREEPARTALVVEVHTDLEVGEEIDEVRVLASSLRGDAGADAGVQMARGPLDDDEPVNVVLEPAAGVMAVRVVAEGYLDGERVRLQTRRTEFVANEVRVLRMDLSRACAMACADEGESCFARGGSARCESDYLDPRYLLKPGEQRDAGGDGEDAAVDAGADASTSDSGTCAPATETCNGADDDCDEQIDEGSTLCPQNEPFAISACSSVGGVTRCRVTACTIGRLDCDDDPDCETAIAAEHCGSCDTACDVGDVCAQTAGSGTGYDCLDRNQCPGTTEVCGSSCVDKQTDPAFCGDCGTACAQLPNAIPACEGGDCQLDCAEGYASCNGDEPDDDGCETNVLTDVMHCGGCEGLNTACPSRDNAETFCDDGICAFRCMDGFLNCNESMTDGCETPIGKDDCYACDNACNGLLEQCCASQRDCCVL
jgi:hypothetical protein